MFEIRRELPEPASVRCTDCGSRVDESEAQAQRWGYWSAGLGELYPFCAVCAQREFGHRSWRLA